MGEWTKVKVWEETVRIPTYKTGRPNKNPMFLEKRVYQGSSGKVYPYPVIEKIYDEKEDKEYRAVFLENEYLKVMILPELGGRIQRAYDKTNDYDFVYYNRVIKPALVGLLGPWISGGIEFNWPQHHRPTTFMPVDYLLSENADGSATVLVNDVDRMYGTKGIAKFTLYPDKAYIEITGQLYNRTNLPQTFLWWANPAVAAGDNTQSVFPPDVHAVMDHGKRDVSGFPIAHGVYYKHDYSAGVDISRYKNIPVPTSYMAEKSDYNFVGGYDYGVGAGILHVADHHVSPGKKQWTWGNGDFGRAWDRNLTDEDGPYIELMTGVYTDNQPDFTWLKPFEEKVFKQYFMPYKGVGYVKNASIDACVNLEFEEGRAHIRAYATGAHERARVQLLHCGEVIFEEEAALSPAQFFDRRVELRGAEESICVEKQSGGGQTDYTVRVLDEDGKAMVEFTPLKEECSSMPQPAKAAKSPEEIPTNEELYLTGLHIEQYRHATYLPDDYYLEGLKRDAGDARINTAYGSLLLSRGLFAESGKYFSRAIERLTWKNPNPYDSESYYKLGLSLFYRKRYAEAYDAFYKATWSSEQQEMSFYYLAAIASIQGEYGQALALVERGLVKNWHNVKARGLKAVLLKKLGRTEEASRWIAESLRIDAFDYLSRREQLTLLSSEERREAEEVLTGVLRGFAESYLQLAGDYAEAGFYREACQVLKECPAEHPMVFYYLSYYTYQSGASREEAAAWYKKAENADSYCCFPNKLEDIAVLEHCMELLPEASFAPYYLGCLWYDKRQYEKAVTCFEASAEKNAAFPTVWRNLSLVYYNYCRRQEEARAAIEKAFALDTADGRVFLELDQLYKKLGMAPEERLKAYEKYRETALERDDTCIEYVSLLNFVGEHEAAYELLTSRKLHPWEGGEGKATGQYIVALTELAKKRMAAGEYTAAYALLKKALVYPENLGEGKLEGSKDNDINYYLGLCAEALGKPEEAESYYALAENGSDEVAGVMYYNDQPADMVFYQGLAKYKLGKKTAGDARMERLIAFGETHLEDEVSPDYFAVSLPDLMIYNEDFTKRNKAHCHYVVGLGELGLGNVEKAREAFRETLKLDASHQKCRLLLNSISECQSK